MDTLAQIYGRHVASGRYSDKGSVHSYIEVYEELLAPYRNAKRVLEVGIFAGHSLRMWEEYFLGAEVVGVDLCDTPHGGLADLRPMIAEGTHRIELFDATDAVQVAQHLSGVFDVIVEDASHNIDATFAIYANLRNHLAPSGIYIIEDIADIDHDRPLFEALDPSVRVFDRRSLKKRFDDVLVVIGGGT